MELLECRDPEAADHLATGALGIDESRQAEDAQVPADQRLREADAGRQLANRQRADLGNQADDAQARLVTQRPVQGAETPKILLGGGLGRRWDHKSIFIK